MGYPDGNWEHRGRSKHEETTKTTTKTVTVTNHRSAWRSGAQVAGGGLVLGGLVVAVLGGAASGAAGSGATWLLSGWSSRASSSPAAASSLATESSPGTPVVPVSPVSPVAEPSATPVREPETAMEFIVNYATAMKASLVEGDLAGWFTPAVDWYAFPAVDHRYLLGVIKPQFPAGTVKPVYEPATYQRFTKGEGSDVLVVQIVFTTATTSGSTNVEYTLVPASSGQPYRIAAVREERASGS